MQDLARSCVSAMREGYKWQASSLSTSVLTVIADGTDQAKFRVPRQLVRSHAFDRLLRPPCMSKASGHTVQATSQQSRAARS